MDEPAFAAIYSFAFFGVVKPIKKKHPYIFNMWQTEYDVRKEKLDTGSAYAEKRRHTEDVGILCISLVCVMLQGHFYA